MTSRAPTLSGLSLLAACPGSASLPRQARTGVYRQGLGHAIHELIAHRINGHNVGSDYDVARLSYAHGLAADDAGRIGFLAEHLRLDVPAGALAEVALGYWLPDRDAEVTPGFVRRFTADEMAEAHARGLRYPDLGQALSGTLDCLWAEPYPLRIYPADGAMPEHVECPPGSIAYQPDWKTGNDENVTPIARNHQLRAGALLAARWTGARAVIPAICYVNAAECAQSLREGRTYGGRWECGALLDAAALDAIEVELRALLSAARGESDAEGDRLRMLWVHVQESAHLQETAGDPLRGGMPHSPAFVLGPHCEHCDARAACPAFAAEALSLANHAGHFADPFPGVALSTDRRSYLAGIIPAMRSALDRAEAAVRAGGPVTLADGREYAPALEEVTTYATGPTFDALSAVVGEEAARGAFRTSAEALKEALAEAGAPRGAWKALRGEIEKAGGVVVTHREVWRRRQPATVAEVVTHEQDDAGRGCGGSDLRGRRAGAADPHGEPSGPVEGVGDRGAPGAHRDDAPGDSCGDQGAAGTDGGVAAGGADRDASAAASVTRATCPTCGKSVAVNRKGGDLRAHLSPGTSMYCRPMAAQTEIGGGM